METQRIIQDLGRFDITLFTLGGTPITVWDIGFIIVALIALFWFSGFLKRWTTRRLLKRHTHLDDSTRQTIGTLVRYVTLVIGFLVKITIGFRVKPEAEVEGIDVAEHAESAYDYSNSGGGGGAGAFALAGITPSGQGGAHAAEPVPSQPANV